MFGIKIIIIVSLGRLNAADWYGERHLTPCTYGNHNDDVMSACELRRQSKCRMKLKEVSGKRGGCEERRRARRAETTTSRTFFVEPSDRALTGTAGKSHSLNTQSTASRAYGLCLSQPLSVSPSHYLSFSVSLGPETRERRELIMRRKLWAMGSDE